jgi:hypothetical protein
MATVTAEIPCSVKVVLDQEIASSRASVSSLITLALATYLRTPVRALFHGSISSDFTAGFYAHAVDLRTVLARLRVWPGYLRQPRWGGGRRLWHVLQAYAKGRVAEENP